MTSLPLSPDTLPAFFLIAVRAVTTLLVAPVFAARSFPVPARVGLGLLLALVLAPAVSGATPRLDDASFPGLVAQEAMVGLVIGFTAQLIFQVLHLGASLVEVQMGLTFAGLVDPASTASESILGQFYSTFAAVIFLAFDGHHMMLLGLSRSLAAFPLGAAGSLALSPDRWIALSASTIQAALQLALPVSGALLLADVALAMLNRSMPQLNVLTTGMPAKLALGFAAAALALPIATAILGARVRTIVDAAAFVLGGS